MIGKLRLGFSDKTVLDALSYLEKGTKEYSDLLDRAYQVRPDVGALASGQGIWVQKAVEKNCCPNRDPDRASSRPAA